MDVSEQFVISMNGREEVTTNSPTSFLVKLLEDQENENIALAVLQQSLGYKVTIMKVRK